MIINSLNGKSIFYLQISKEYFLHVSELRFQFNRIGKNAVKNQILKDFGRNFKKLHLKRHIHNRIFET